MIDPVQQREPFHLGRVRALLVFYTHNSVAQISYELQIITNDWN